MSSVQTTSHPCASAAARIMLPPTAPAADSPPVVAAMKAYVTGSDELALRATLETVIAECHAAVRPAAPEESAGARAEGTGRGA